MTGRAHGNVNGTVGGAGCGEIDEGGVRIAHAVQDIVGQHRVEISADQFAKRGLVEFGLLDAQVAQTTARSRSAASLDHFG